MVWYFLNMNILLNLCVIKILEKMKLKYSVDKEEAQLNIFPLEATALIEMDIVKKKKL